MLPFLIYKNAASKGVIKQCFYFAGVIATLILCGCASDFSDTDLQRSVLEPRANRTGAPMGMPTLSGQPASARSPGAGYITLLRPTAISAQGNYLYLQDAGLRHISSCSSCDRSQQTLVPAANLPVEAGVSIYVAPDFLVYISEPARGQVLHFASRGNLAHPVSVVVDASNVLV